MHAPVRLQLHAVTRLAGRHCEVGRPRHRLLDSRCRRAVPHGGGLGHCHQRSCLGGGRFGALQCSTSSRGRRPRRRTHSLDRAGPRARRLIAGIGGHLPQCGCCTLQPVHYRRALKLVHHCILHYSRALGTGGAGASQGGAQAAGRAQARCCSRGCEQQN